MKSRAILLGFACPFLVACASEGGMDGAGSLGIGLAWDQGIFLQAVWDDGAPVYVVHNHREEGVQLTFSRTRCDNGPDGGCVFGDSIVSSYLPASVTQKLEVAQIAEIAREDGYVGVSANGSAPTARSSDSSGASSRHERPPSRC
jgi:hypothetical protein